jgi:hypothetical protein
MKKHTGNLTWKIIYAGISKIGNNPAVENPSGWMESVVQITSQDNN